MAKTDERHLVQSALPTDNTAVSELLQCLDTENYKFSDIDGVTNHIDNNQCFVIRGDGELLGVVILDVDDQSLQVKYIVSKAKGGGRDLLRFSEEYALDRNLLKIWCWSLVRYQAIGFYAKMGFTEQFLLKKQNYGEDCYIFGKVLQK